MAFPRDFPTRLSHEAFPQGYPTCHLGEDLILEVNVEAVQGKQVPLEWTEISVGHWQWWYDPGVPLAFSVETASS